MLSRRQAIAGVAGLALTGKASARPNRSPVIDGLSFLPEDMGEIATSGLNAMICDVSVVDEIKGLDGAPRYARTASRNIPALANAVKRIEASATCFVGKRGSDIGSRPGCAAYLQFQSCDPLDGKVDNLVNLHTMGLRVLQFTHHHDNIWAGAAIEKYQSGLTDLGRDCLAEMNRLRMLTDVSHGSAPTIIEAAGRSSLPIAYSHGAARALVDNPRCIDNAGIRAIADNGGVVGIFMMSFWLTRELLPRLEHLIAQIRHVIRVGGLETVAIANDFPMSGEAGFNRTGSNTEAVKDYLAWWRAMDRRGVPGFERDPLHVVIPELNRLDRLPRIADGLQRSGFKPRELDRIMGGNLSRVLHDTLG